jgi:regulator of sigma E protease
MFSLFYFIIALIILVLVHEFGHFWVARRCGVKVLKFSVGFGKALWQHKGKDGTEYVLGTIPLGGYVKMLDEREGDVDKTELDQAFNRKSLAVRTAVVAAGPIANLLFAVVAYWLIAVIGITGFKPLIGDVAEGTVAAQAGLSAGDEIISVNDDKTPFWNEVYQHFAIAAEQGSAVRLVVQSDYSEFERQLLIEKKAQQVEVSLLEQIGITPAFAMIEPVVDKVIANSPADNAGLKQGDILVAFNGKQLALWSEWVKLIQDNAGKPLQIDVERDQQLIQLVLTPIETKDGRGQIGVAPVVPQYLSQTIRLGPFEAVAEAVVKTAKASMMMINGLTGMLTGTVALDNLGGPISIA